VFTDPNIDLVRKSIQHLYTVDKKLIDDNLCERCLVHRLAIHLQQHYPDFFVDCEFNVSSLNNVVSKKMLSNVNGNYVDIIVHKRSNVLGENLLCFEVKKSNNTKDREKDVRNLEILTGERFGYLLGFHIILGKNYEETMIEIFSDGVKLSLLDSQ
jgi:hypothetical protein